jgi:hypothetical protein
VTLYWREYFAIIHAIFDSPQQGSPATHRRNDYTGIVGYGNHRRDIGATMERGHQRGDRIISMTLYLRHCVLAVHGNPPIFDAKHVIITFNKEIEQLRH